MGDFAAADLRRPDGLYPHHAGAACAGCHGRIDDAERAYADNERIWHSRCWPTADGSRRDLETQLGYWRQP